MTERSKLTKRMVNPFVMVPKSIMDSPNLTAGAKAFYAYLLGRPDNWEFWFCEILKHFKEGKHKVRSMRQELVDNGLLIFEAGQKISGKFTSSKYILLDVEEIFLPRTDFRDPEIRDPEIRDPENEIHNNNNYNKKDISNNDIIKPYAHFANAQNGHDQHSLNMSSDKSSQQYTADGNLKHVVEFKNDFDTLSHADDSKSIESLKMTKKAKQEKTASRISDDWFLSDDLILQAQKISKQFNLLISKEELEIIGDGFKDYWLAKKGKDAEKMNWDATWRNWIRTDMLRRVEKAQPKIVIHKQHDILEQNRKVFEEFDRKQENRGSKHREHEINPIDVMLGLSKT